MTNKMVFIEGPSCSGKSTVLNALKDDERISIVSKQWPAVVENPNLEFFLERDQDKMARALAELNRRKLVIVDRSYLSTIAFYTIKALKVNDYEFAQVIDFVSRQRDAGVFVEPDAIIYLDVSPATTLRRSKNIRSFDDNNMWLKYPKDIRIVYQLIFAGINGDIPIYTVNGEDSELRVTAEVAGLINEIYEA